jgi:predicted solute-binding protein
VIASYHASLDLLAKERQDLIAQARRRYPDIHYDVDSYYRTLQYTFSPSLREALRFYFDKAGDLGLLRQVGPIRFYEGSSRA